MKGGRVWISALVPREGQLGGGGEETIPEADMVSRVRGLEKETTLGGKSRAVATAPSGEGRRLLISRPAVGRVEKGGGGRNGDDEDGQLPTPNRMLLESSRARGLSALLLLATAATTRSFVGPPLLTRPHARGSSRASLVASLASSESEDNAAWSLIFDCDGVILEVRQICDQNAGPSTHLQRYSRAHSTPLFPKSVLRQPHHSLQEAARACKPNPGPSHPNITSITQT